jgi:endonuclease/exonuclease/phosphatase family metal-dependent hydrolase
METRSQSWPGRIAVLTTALGTMLVPASTAAAAGAGADHDQPGKPITVMTRNLYLGADINAPVQAVAGITDPTLAFLTLGRATYQTRKVVDRTNFPRRSELLAAEIAANNPDLVGLQEVALWRSGPLEPTKVAVPNATTVDYDFLQILLQDLADAGMEYRAVSVQQEADVEAPSFESLPGPGARDIRLTMRDVVLMRVDDGLTLLDEGIGHYDSALTVPVAGKAMRFTRGYNWVDVRVGSRELRFINTHFEAFGSNYALAQAQELMAGPANHEGTTIIACDCNTNPLEDRVTGGVEHRAPYNHIVDQGFTDQWLEWRPADQGLTSGLNETVDEATPSFTNRIDFIFARTTNGEPLAVDRGGIVGADQSVRDAAGIWPSDHAGVVLRLRGLAP